MLPVGFLSVVMGTHSQQVLSYLLADADRDCREQQGYTADASIASLEPSYIILRWLELITCWKLEGLSTVVLPTIGSELFLYREPLR